MNDTVAALAASVWVVIFVAIRVLLYVAVFATYFKARAIFKLLEEVAVEQRHGRNK